MAMPSARAGSGRFFHERDDMNREGYAERQDDEGHDPGQRMKPVAVGAAITR